MWFGGISGPREMLAYLVSIGPFSCTIVVCGTPTLHEDSLRVGRGAVFAFTTERFPIVPLCSIGVMYALPLLQSSS